MKNNSNLPSSIQTLLSAPEFNRICLIREYNIKLAGSTAGRELRLMHCIIRSPYPEDILAIQFFYIILRSLIIRPALNQIFQADYQSLWAGIFDINTLTKFESGIVWSHICPGPFSVVRNNPSPPNNTFLNPPTDVMSMDTVSSYMAT